MEITLKTQEILDFLEDILAKQIKINSKNTEIYYENINLQKFNKTEFDKYLYDLEKLGDIEIEKNPVLNSINDILFLRITSEGQYNSLNKNYKNILIEKIQKEKEEEKDKKRRQKFENSTIHKNRIYVWSFYLSIILNIVFLLLLLLND